MNNEEIKIITLGDIFKNIETEEKAFKFLKYIKELQQENQQLKENYDRIYNENCKLREEHNITDISLLDENHQLKKEKKSLMTALNTSREKYNNDKVRYRRKYKNLKKQKADVVEYIKKHIQEYDVDGSPTNLDEFDFLASPKTLLRMLGEIE